jgi:hypothetical protein
MAVLKTAHSFVWCWSSRLPKTVTVDARKPLP